MPPAGPPDRQPIGSTSPRRELAILYSLNKEQNISSSNVINYQKPDASTMHQQIHLRKTPIQIHQMPPNTADSLKATRCKAKTSPKLKLPLCYYSCVQYANIHIIPD
jgi:hypothetical protein